MSYYDDTEGYKALGMDYDLVGRLQMDDRLGITTTATSVQIKQDDGWKQVASDTNPKRILLIAATNAVNGREVRLVMTETKVVKIVDEDQLFKNILGG